MKLVLLQIAFILLTLVGSIMIDRLVDQSYVTGIFFTASVVLLFASFFSMFMQSLTFGLNTAVLSLALAASTCFREKSNEAYVLGSVVGILALTIALTIINLIEEELDIKFYWTLLAVAIESLSFVSILTLNNENTWFWVSVGSAMSLFLLGSLVEEYATRTRKS
ncbi:hypothetical protein HYV69_01970 [Candidatus Uhrbacteria bacterium]|nr:hypothetical protein [Candidatus Uhrbacteria bacterium]